MIIKFPFSHIGNKQSQPTTHNHTPKPNKYLIQTEIFVRVFTEKNAHEYMYGLVNNVILTTETDEFDNE